jgi:membrane protease YdiL (CAAX protease family)
MMGLLVEIAISWLILWVFAKKNLNALGLIPNRNRVVLFFAGLAVAVLCCIIYTGVKTLFENSQWRPNKNFTTAMALKSFSWVFNSVLYEELIFRGALLYIAVKKIGETTAVLLSAVCFGIYHWFSYNALGNPVQMIIIFFMTAIWGYMFAKAFVRTGSLYLPIVLHLGWNLAFSVIFSNGPIGNQLLVKYGGEYLAGGISIFVFLIQLFMLPLITFLVLLKSRYIKTI